MTKAKNSYKDAPSVVLLSATEINTDPPLIKSITAYSSIMIGNQPDSTIGTDTSAPVASLTRKLEAEKLRYRQATTVNYLLISILKKFQYEKGNIKHVSYIYFVILLQLHLLYISKMFDLIINFGAEGFLVLHSVLMFLIGLPTFMLIVSMARYYRRGYISFWHCVPILQGMGYTCVLSLSLTEIINMSLSALSLTYIKRVVINGVPWFKERVNTTFTTKVSLDFFRSSNISGLGLINSNLAMAVSILWLILLVLMICGFKTFQSKMRKIQIFVFCVWIAIFIITITSSYKYRKSIKKTQKLWNAKFILHVLLFVISENFANAIVWLAALDPSSSLPTTDAIVVYSFKFLTLSVLIVWIQTLLRAVCQHKKIDVLSLTGFDVIFAVIPFTITECPFSNLITIVWFLAISFHGFSSALYVLTATVDSLSDAFSKISQYRGHACVLICTICCLINLVFATQLGVVLTIQWLKHGNVIVTIVTVSITVLSLISVYSIQRLVDDYHFMFGLPPFKLWIELWKMIPFIILVQTAFSIYEYIARKEDLSGAYRKWTTVAAFLIILPILVVMLFIYLKFLKSHMVSSIIRPDANWSYYIKSKRMDRELFNPHTEMRCNMSRLKCNHKCLVNSEKLKEVQKTNDSRVNEIFQRLKSNTTVT